MTMYCIILPIYICLSAFNLLILPITKNIIMANQNLGKAKKEKKDEFYTQLGDINKEMQAYLDYNPDVFRDKTVLLPCDDPEWSNFTRFFALNPHCSG